MTNTIAHIHKYWFGPLDDQGLAGQAHQRLWFSASDQTDRELQERFGAAVSRALAGQLDNWAGTDEGLVALVLLLDQFTRNIYRGTPQAFAGDAAALALAREAIDNGRHQDLPTTHRVFLYMPLEHSEVLAHQRECVQLFTDLAAERGSEQIEGFGRYAVAHCEVIARFGRFPHRNTILGRQSSAEEIAYLAAHGGF